MKSFIQSLISEDGQVSSKRFIGVIFLLAFVILVFVSLFVTFSLHQIAMMDKLAYIGAGLLGLTVFDNASKIFKKVTK